MKHRKRKRYRFRPSPLVWVTWPHSGVDGCPPGVMAPADHWLWLLGLYPDSKSLVEFLQ